MKSDHLFLERTLKILKTLPEHDFSAIQAIFNPFFGSRDVLLSPCLWSQPSVRHTLRCTRFPWQCHRMSKQANVKLLKGVNQGETVNEYSMNQGPI